MRKKEQERKSRVGVQAEILSVDEWTDCNMTKYNNVKTVVDGIEFDSKREARRYFDLKLLQQAGKIRGFELQKRFELAPAVKLDGRTKPALRYIADFYYVDVKTGQPVIEDVKGVKTDVYRIKKHLMKSVLNLEIVEI